jgi:hypothetical protein
LPQINVYRMADNPLARRNEKLFEKMVGGNGFEPLTLSV